MVVATVKDPKSRRSTRVRVLRSFMVRLRAARVTADLTQGELAAKLGMTQGQISHYEKGIRQPNLGELCDIADALNVSLEELISSD